MNEALAFISHSSRDKDVADQLGFRLMQLGTKVWIDDQQIGFGDSIPGKISDGLRRCTVILVLVSKHYIESSWCRAEYEPLLMNEIHSGRTTVIPVLLDDSEMPILLRTKRYFDLRKGMPEAALQELSRQIARGTVETSIQRLPTDRSYECSLLSMVIGGVVKDFPVATMTDKELGRGHSLLDLYRTVDLLITQFQNVSDVMLSLSLEKTDLSYGRKLRDIEREMQTLVSAFDGLLKRNSALRTRLSDIFHLCVCIEQEDSALVVHLGGNQKASGRDAAVDGERRSPSLEAAGKSDFLSYRQAITGEYQ